MRNGNPALLLGSVAIAAPLTKRAVKVRVGDGALDEQSFRYNERHDTDAQRFQKVLGSVAGKRLDWKTLTSQEVG